MLDDIISGVGEQLVPIIYYADFGGCECSWSDVSIVVYIVFEQVIPAIANAFDNSLAFSIQALIFRVMLKTLVFQVGR